MERLRPNRKAAIILHDEDDDQDDQESMSDHEEWTPSDNDTPKKPGGAKRRLHADSGSDDTETPAKRAKRPAAPRAPRVPKAPKEPKAPRAPRVPKAPRAPRVPKAPKEPKAPRAPRVPKAPKEPKAPKIPKATKAREKPETLSPRKPVAVKEEPPWSPGRGALAGIAIGVAGQALAIKPDPHTSTNREPHSHSATGPHVKKEPHSDSATGPHVKKEPHSDSATGPHVKKEPHSDSATGPHVKKEPHSHSATGPHVKKEPHSDSATGPHVKKEPVAVSWTVAQAVARQLALSEGVVQQVVRLLDEEYTIPFIARYRRELTNDMDADMLRQVEESVHQLRAVQKKVKSAVATLQKDDQLTARLQQALQECRCVEELEILVAPLKTSSRQSKAERARRLGLEAAAQTVLTEPHRLDMVALVRPAEPGLSTLAEVEAGVQHILADIIAKDRATMDMVRKMCENSMVMIESSLSAAAKTSLHKGKEGARDGGLSARSFHGKAPHGKRQDINNFEKYFSFQKPISRVENYEVLALNRGENLKILTVKINIPVQVKTNFHSWCLNQRWRLLVPFVPPYVQQLLSNSLEDSLKRLIIPLVTRHYRASLTRRAELASISLFAKNLRKLLLVPPVRGRSVLGIDPGFRHGCKLALTSPTGQVVATDVIFLDDTKRSQATVRNLLLQHRCETVAIGNGCGCREAECFVSELIQSGSLRPLNVVYSIVNENGASIYSVSPEAQQEMPGMDPNLRSAVSIARRLQDPLAELVKIDPKHLGIGMYQHDLPDAQLKVALRGVVQECVSFVGVDINACSVTLLGYVSGLSSVLARRIVEWREQQGPFLCRQQLLRVKGMGPKTFLQCAGFVRVNPAPSSTGPATSSSAGVGAGVGGSEPGANPAPAPGRKKRTRQGGGPEEGEEEEVANPLDRTWIHPESYAIAHRLLRLIGGSAEQVGRPELRRRVEAALAQHGSVEALAQAVGTTVPTLQIVLDGLKQPHDHDIRAELQKPIFRRTVMTLEELHVGMSLQGRVVSYTDFGAFVDIGVGQKALIPKRFITAQNSLPTGQGGADRRSSFLLGPGDRVEVRVHHMELARNRITLALERML
uniref:S1 RNA-binding domain-containing protein 1 isoform X2 n=1 Tax=Petromyzon marinus TaxID=7757 RepID=A0AAJ7U7C4_PETMA|nr:S1 RNA-binding domain-containing protein 1 isoform X2 [Petromyzon marinus]